MELLTIKLHLKKTAWPHTIFCHSLISLKNTQGSLGINFMQPSAFNSIKLCQKLENLLIGKRLFYLTEAQFSNSLEICHECIQLIENIPLSSCIRQGYFLVTISWKHLKWVWWLFFKTGWEENTFDVCTWCNNLVSLTWVSSFAIPL